MKKTLVCILAAALAVSFAGCKIEVKPLELGNEESSEVSVEESLEEEVSDESEQSVEESSQDESSVESVEESAEESAEEQSTEEEPVNVQAGAATAYKLTAEKVLSLTADQAKKISALEAKEYSILFKGESDKFGIITADSSAAVEAKYTNIHEESPDGKEQKNVYFTEMTVPVESADKSKPESYNCVGLINEKGEQVIPEKYASIDVLSDRYAEVITVSGVTTSKEDALVYATDRAFSFSASDGDTLLKGTWEIFDMTTGNVVSGVKGNKNTVVNAKGKFIYADSKYYDDQGKEQSKDVQILDYGYYTAHSGDKTVVYNNEGKKLFEYESSTQAITKAFENDYFVALDSKDYKNYITDSSGKRLSGAVDGNISDVYGNFFIIFKDSKYTVCDKTGKNLLGKEFKYVIYDDTADVFICESDKECEYYDAELGFIGSMKTDDSSVTSMKYKGVSYSGSSGKYTVNLLNGETKESDKSVISESMFIYYNTKANVYNSINGEVLVNNEDGARIEICSKDYKMIKLNSDGTADVYKFSFSK